jgi:hypothetical protein
MAAANSRSEAAVRKGLIKMVARIVTASVVTHPGLAIDVGNIGVVCLIAVVAIGFDGMRGRSDWRRPARRNGLMRPATGRMGFTTAAMLLGKCRNCENERSCQNQLDGFHGYLLMSSVEKILPFPVGKHHPLLYIQHVT